MDMDADLLPSRTANDVNKNKIGWYWDEGFKGIKYAKMKLKKTRYGVPPISSVHIVITS